MVKLQFLFFLVLFVGVCLAKEDRCNQPADSGICYGYVPMYAFDTESGECRSLVYGGCGGNDNKFGSLQECQSACEN